MYSFVTQLTILVILVLSVNAANNTTVISLGLIWDTSEAASDFQRLFFSNFHPKLFLTCPTEAVLDNFQFQLSSYSITTLPTEADLQAVSAELTRQKFLFFGIKNNSLTAIAENVLANTSIAQYPIMKLHVVAPMPMHLLTAALLRVIQQRVAESVDPSNVQNYRAAFFIDHSTNVLDLHQLFAFFKHGAIYFKFDSIKIQQQLLQVKTAGIVNIVVMLNYTAAAMLRRQAYQYSMFDYQYRWFLHGSRLINDNLPTGQAIISMNVTSIEFGRLLDTQDANLWNASTILIYDLMQVWQPYLINIVCNQSANVSGELQGLTGTFQYWSDGSAVRTRWDLQVYLGMGHYAKQVGFWASNDRFEMLPNPDPKRTVNDSLSLLQRNVSKLLLVTLIYPPYVQYRPDVPASASMAERLTGMYIELCRRLMQELQITNYEFILQADGAFGTFNTSWNGIIKTMMDGKAHLACVPITVTASRKAVVTFSRTIHSSRLSILYKRASADPVLEVFQFISPLNSQIWLSILAVLFIVAIVLAVLHKLAPNRKVNFNFYNSLFFSFAEVVQGSSGATPNRASSRIVVSFFWYFTLFLLLAYIANYAAFRTLEGATSEVNSLSSLLQNRAYEFGMIRDSVTSSLLQSSTYTTMQQAFKLMTEVFVHGQVSGIDEAVSVMQNASRKFALISDSWQNQFYSEIGCSMVNTGDFYELQNSLTLPKNSELETVINQEVAKLADVITQLKNQFFTVTASQKPNCNDGSFTAAIQSYTPSEPWPTKEGALGLKDTIGIALINLIGCCVALILSGVERGLGALSKCISERRRRQQMQKMKDIADELFAAS